MKPIIALSIYNLITLTLVTVLLILCKKRIRKERTKDFVLKSVSIAVVVLHYSSLYVDFFANSGNVEIDHNMLFPIYPCNITMWLLVIVAFWKKRNQKTYQVLAEFVFIVGTFCGLVGVLYNFNFLDSTNGFADYEALKGILSHTVMIFGTIYLGVMNYIKIRVPNGIRSVFWGLILFIAIGAIINTVFISTGIDKDINAMYMMEPPIPSLPFFNFFVLGVLGLFLVFIGLIIFERFALPKEERWLNKILNKKGV